MPHGTAHEITTAIADRRAVDPLTDGLDHPGALVTEQHRERRTPVAVLTGPEVAVTHAVRHHPDEHLTRLGIVDDDRLDHDRSPERVDDGAHRLPRHRALRSIGRGSLYCPA